MSSQSQIRIRLHQRRLALGYSMTELSKVVGHPRESVSRAVNKGYHPRVLAKVKEALRA